MKKKHLYITTKAHPFLKENVQFTLDDGNLLSLEGDIEIYNTNQCIEEGWVVEKQEPEFTADDVIRLANMAYHEHFHSSEYDTYDQCIKDITSKARKK